MALIIKKQIISSNGTFRIKASFEDGAQTISLSIEDNGDKEVTIEMQPLPLEDFCKAILEELKGE